MTGSILDNDGCSFFPEGWGDVSWGACCDLHDLAFSMGHTWAEFVAANMALYHCASQQNMLAAVLMAIGVFSPIAAVLFRFGRKQQETIDG